MSEIFGFYGIVPRCFSMIIMRHISMCFTICYIYCVQKGVDQMYSEGTNSVWSKKGATLSDKSARKEFGLAQSEIIKAIKNGKLQYRNNNMFGNPYFKLIRSEVEALVEEKYGSNYLKKKKIRHELSQVNKELKMLNTKLASLEQRKTDLLACLDI